MIVLLDKLRHVAGRARGGNVFERLRGLRIEANAWHVLREHGNERKPEALVKIRDELVARHLFELAVVARALLERQMPVHVVGIPPGILQALPEEARLANAADFMTPRDDSLLAVLPHQLAQRVHQFRSEEHTSELQSQSNLVCRLLLEKKKKNNYDVLVHNSTSS